MNYLLHIPNQNILNRLTILKNSVDKIRNSSFKKRLKKNPFLSDFEYLLGAFLEMYEPHLLDVVYRFSKQGYAIDASSGFCGKFAESQTLVGNFLMDYITKNKLENMGIKLREVNGLKCLMFWPDHADLDEIKAKWFQVIKLLPDKGMLHSPLISLETIAFRMKYVPKNKLLQKQRLFERLQHQIFERTKHDLKKRKDRNVHPDKIENSLGIFVEELEIQVREAVLNLTKKGYSIDSSGFMNDPCCQMIEGDFKLQQEIVENLKQADVVVETNGSGYTRLQFSPSFPSMAKIKKQWNRVVSILPKIHESAAPSMTRTARDFRLKYVN